MARCLKRKRLFQYPAPPRHGSCWTTWKTGDGHREEVSPQQGRREPETSHRARGSGGAFASWKKTSPSSTNLWRVPCAMSKLWRGEAVPPKNSLLVHGSKRGRGLRTISLNHNEGDPEIHPRKARRIKGNFTENCQRSLRTELTDTHTQACALAAETPRAWANVPGNERSFGFWSRWVNWHQELVP